MIKTASLFFIGFITTLTGCATISSEVQNRASKDLQGVCFAVFSYPRYEGDQPAGMYAGHIGYQYWSASLQFKAFAIGYGSNNGQVCAYDSMGRLVENSSQDKVTSSAVNKCNTLGLGSCVVYAIDDDKIIYNKEAHTDKMNKLIQAKFMQDYTTRTEADKTKRLQAEVEEKKRIEMQQQAAQRERESSENVNETSIKSTPLPENVVKKLSIDVAKEKCTELGFKSATEGFGKCVLQLSK